MLANDYDESTVSRDEWRVLDRIGARDPAGIKRAMRKYDVDTMDELVKLLKHHKPVRKPGERLKKAVGRMFGDYWHDPHKKEFNRAFKYHQSAEEKQVIQRMKKVKAIYSE